MAAKKRKVEVYRLTISGLDTGTAYGAFLRDLWKVRRSKAELVMKHGEKNHALTDLNLRNHRLYMRFMSFTKGHRPDVLDTNRFSLSPNPLSPTQTGVEYTHVLGGLSSSRYIILVERNQSGIWPTTIERYLQWLVDKFYQPHSTESQEPVTISLEAEPGEEFLERINSLERVTEATVRIVRPNPGWHDLDNELGNVAQDSDAHKAEVTMNARRNSSLKLGQGILQWIKNKFSDRTLDFASVKGQRGNHTDTFNTEKLGRHSRLTFATDDRGQVVSTDAWGKMSQMMDEL